MRDHGGMTTAALLGAAVGMVVLGALGRAVMAGVALATGRDVNLSARGLVEVLGFALLVGAAGGLLLRILRRLLDAGAVARGMALGGALFAGSLLFLGLRGGVDPGDSVLPLTMLAAAAVYAIYGILLDVLLTRLERPSAAGNRPAHR